MKKRLLYICLTFVMCFMTVTPVLAAPLELDEAAKSNYYAEYLEIVEEINQKMDTDVSVKPIQEFSADDWMTPAEFRTLVAAVADWKIVCTDSASNHISDNRSLPDAIATKSDTITVDGRKYTISVTGKFDTMLLNGRQVFDGIVGISSESSTQNTKWRQTGYTSSLIDSRRTYSITVSGTFTVAGAVFPNKLVDVDFYCDAYGNVS